MEKIRTYWKIFYFYYISGEIRFDYYFNFMMITCIFKTMALCLFEDYYTFIIIICAIPPGGTRETLQHHINGKLRMESNYLHLLNMFVRSIKNKLSHLRSLWS